LSVYRLRVQLVQQKKQPTATITSSAISAAKEYALDTANEKLDAEFTISYAALCKTPEEEFNHRIQHLFNLVKPLAPHLAVYGLTLGIVEAWNLSLTTHSASFKNPKAAMEHRKKLVSCFNLLFRNAQTFFPDFLDPLADSLKLSDPDFTKEYYVHRKRIELAEAVPSIRGTIGIQNSIPNNFVPVSGATISIVETGVVVTSDSNGQFSFKQVKKGKYKLRAEKEGFFTKTTGVLDLRDSEPIRLSFELVPAEVLQD
jgi:hypothetical protein